MQCKVKPDFPTFPSRTRVRANVHALTLSLGIAPPRTPAITVHYRPDRRHPWRLVATVASLAEALDLQAGSGDWCLQVVPAEHEDTASATEAERVEPAGLPAGGRRDASDVIAVLYRQRW